MKSPLLAAVFGLLALSPLGATTIGFSSSPTGNSLYDANGTVLPNNDLLRVGYFSNPGAVSLSMTPAQIASAGGWTDFGDLYTSSITVGSASFPGKITGQYTDNTANATSFNSQNLYVWAFNATTTGAATATGIFRASSGTPVWTFPTNASGAPGDSVVLNVDDATMQAISGFGSVNASQNKLQLSSFSVPVPEASSTSSVYALTGAFLFGCRRFRFRRQA